MEKMRLILWRVISWPRFTPSLNETLLRLLCTITRAGFGSAQLTDKLSGTGESQLLMGNKPLPGSTASLPYESSASPPNTWTNFLIRRKRQTEIPALSQELEL